MTKTNGFGEPYGRVMVKTSWNELLIWISSLFYEICHSLAHDGSMADTTDLLVLGKEDLSTPCLEPPLRPLSLLRLALDK